MSVIPLIYQKSLEVLEWNDSRTVWGNQLFCISSFFFLIIVKKKKLLITFLDSFIYIVYPHPIWPNVLCFTPTFYQRSAPTPPLSGRKAEVFKLKPILSSVHLDTHYHLVVFGGKMLARSLKNIWTDEKLVYLCSAKDKMVSNLTAILQYVKVSNDELLVFAVSTSAARCFSLKC